MIFIKLPIFSETKHLHKNGDLDLLEDEFEAKLCNAFHLPS